MICPNCNTLVIPVSIETTIKDSYYRYSMCNANTPNILLITQKTYMALLHELVGLTYTYITKDQRLVETFMGMVIIKTDTVATFKVGYMQ